MKHLSSTIGIATLCMLGLLSAPAQAQRRYVNNPLLLPELQAEYALRGDDYLLLRLQGPLQTGRFDGTQLTQLGLQLGYERFWSTAWSGGATVRSAAYTAYRNGGDVQRLYLDLAPELFVRHWNTFGKFNFRQRLGVEYLFPGDPLGEGRAIARLRLDIDREVPVGKLTLRPRLAYEAAANLRLQRADDEPKERVIDYGNLRADLGIRVSPRFDFTPWVASDTRYSFVLDRLDPDGNVLVPGGKFNYVTPVVGLDVRYTLNGRDAERRQLPTQH